MEEPGRLQSMGSQRVGQNWVTSLSFYSSFWRRKWQPNPVFLPRESHGQRDLVGYSLWGCKELDTTKQLTRRRQWHPTPALLPGKSHGWRSLVGHSDFTFTFHFHALEKEMATHSSVLAWRIPGTGEPGGLPSVGSHRVGHD